MKFGINVPIDQSLYNTYKNCIGNQDACQIVMPENVDIRDLVKCKKLLNDNKNFYTCFHGNMIYNLAGSVKGNSDPQFGRKLGKCKNILVKELDTASFLRKGVVVHVGYRDNFKEGLDQVIKTLNEVLVTENNYTYSYAKYSGISMKELKDNRKIILENSAGRNNQLGSNLDEISYIISQVNPQLRDNISVCIDTCHIFDAGKYDIGKKGEIDRFFKDFDILIGINKLEVFHLNDSLNEFDSKMDIHAHLTKGYIFNSEEGIKSLKYLLHKNGELGTPMIGEFNDGEGQQDLDLIRSYVNTI